MCTIGPPYMATNFLVHRHFHPTHAIDDRNVRQAHIVYTIVKTLLKLFNSLCLEVPVLLRLSYWTLKLKGVMTRSMVDSLSELWFPF